MTEHTVPEATEVQTLDALAARHHLRRNPDGAFYALTEMKRVVRITPYNTTGQLLMVEGFGGQYTRGYLVRRVSTDTEKGRNPTHLPSYGVVRIIVFVGREATSLEDLAEIAGPHYNELTKAPDMKFEVMDKLDNVTAEGPHREFYLLVQKHHTKYPSMFHAIRTSREALTIMLVRQDANMSRGAAVRSPDAYDYRPGGPFVVRTESGKSKERDAGTVLGIIRKLAPMSKDELFEALRDAWSTSR